MTETIETGDLVSFANLNNARGYAATGEVIEVAGSECTIQAWGLYGPGSETKVNGVPLNELKLESTHAQKS